ncbi:MAG: hypothetical protein PHQ23_07955 [Candidatus Wallbacteria bacterium]|nr:hypothetical protein [Candidatus Wallbacteria bacterium]
MRRDLRKSGKESVFKAYCEEMSRSGITLFRPGDLKKYFRENCAALGAAGYNRFVSDAVESGILQRRTFHVLYAGKTYYTSGYFELKSDFEKMLELAAAVYENGYFSHFTAVYLNGLSEQIPKVVCINTEQKKSGYYNNPEAARKALTDEKIALAFAKDKRQSGFCAEEFDYRLLRVSGKNTKNSGVFKRKLGEFEFRVTDPERTLIDVTVTPEYAGGIYSVLKAYQTAAEWEADPVLSVDKLVRYLKRIAYIYPYHQAVGFLLDCAGIDRKITDGFRAEFEIRHDFYLVHGSAMNRDKRNLVYSGRWKIYAPRLLFEQYQELFG